MAQWVHPFMAGERYKCKSQWPNLPNRSFSNILKSPGPSLRAKRKGGFFGRVLYFPALVEHLPF